MAKIFVRHGYEPTPLLHQWIYTVEPKLNELLQLHCLYINPRHTALLSKLYLPLSPLLQYPLLQTLRAAATTEILKTTRREIMLPELIYQDAREAFKALSVFLGEEAWFSGGETPGVFDAEVFAYTYLISGGVMEWEDDALEGCLEGCANLVEHRRRLYERCWGEGSV